MPLIANATTLDEQPYAAQNPRLEDIAVMPPQGLKTAQEAKIVPNSTKVAVDVSNGVREAVEAEFGHDSVMVHIAEAESSFIPTAKNPHSTAKGVFQILDGTWESYKCTGEVSRAKDNIACARKIYDNEGTHPWLASASDW